MKIWEVDSKDVKLKRDTSTYNAIRDELRRVAIMNKKIQELVSEEFDDITFWNTSLHWADVEDWQCGSIGPKGKICLRCKHHRGKCSDFFSPADNQQLCARRNNEKKAQLAEIIGKSDTRKFSKEKIQALLEEEHAR